MLRGAVTDRHNLWTWQARDASRAEDALAAVPRAEAVVVGDLSSMDVATDVARQANALGTFDAVIHNAAVGNREPRRIETRDGFPHVFAVNTLAVYLLTALMHAPQRLVYVSSGLHRRGDASLTDLGWRWFGRHRVCPGAKGAAFVRPSISVRGNSATSRRSERPNSAQYALILGPAW